ncbi:hypothetical protein ABT187_29860 [Streptomyces sp. NPDC001817]|uniref:hypothetical protein n=1 Tax=Streptomyces sp. NPDC001817 TaxID=3154398 RepID=UPI00331AC761
MEHVKQNGRASSSPVRVGLGVAAVFEASTLLATQDKTVRAASPWQDDPYDVVVSLAQFAVPMLALVIGLRLLARQAPGGADRVRQTVRAAAAMITLVALTLGVEWAAVVARTPALRSRAWTSVLIGGLTVNSVLTTVVVVLLVRSLRRHGPSGGGGTDWLGDAVFVCRRIPVLRRSVGPDTAAWMRRRAMTVFVGLSTLAAAALTAAQAVGERWTDPLLIAWFLIVETTTNLAFCVISNAVAGFVARPPRTRLRRIAEASVVAGCVAISGATAFRDTLWPLFCTGSLTSVPAVAALTLGAGLVTSAGTAALLLAGLPWNPSGLRRRFVAATARLRPRGMSKSP